MAVALYTLKGCPAETADDLLTECPEVPVSVLDDGMYHTLVNGRGQRVRVSGHQLTLFLYQEDTVE